MKIIKAKYCFISLAVLMAELTACTTDFAEEKQQSNNGKSAAVYVSLNEVDVRTRVNHDPYDTWSVASFSSGDIVGFYAITGNQDPDDKETFNQPVDNQPMYFAGRVGNYYKFDNPKLILDPELVHGSFSFMYYPYYQDMPNTTDSELKRGIPMRKTDPEDGIEKCIDFMSTLWMFNYTNYRYLPLVNGMLQPQFYHHNCILGIQRGEGFDNPGDNEEDYKMWVVCQNPYTDVRVYQNGYKNTGECYFRFDYQYILQDGEDPVQPIDPNIPDLNEVKVNKYRVWECWKGNNYNNIETYYAILPYGQTSPYNSVNYILIKDNYGRWQKVSDFYLNETGSKALKNNTRFMLKVKMEGLNPVVRPVIIEDWNEEERITDDRKVGIQTEEEFAAWVSAYNAYTPYRDQPASIPEDIIEKLKPYGDAQRIGEDGKIKWTFYINSDIQLKPDGKYQIENLYDILEGSSVYTNYSISNLRHSLINEIEEGGQLRALDFDGLYIIDIIDNMDPYSKYFCGALAKKMNDGIISNVNINNGILVSNQIAGMIAGTISGGTVNNCRIS
ncbi:MAG: hypothetical protein J1E95_08775, partial [Muribaculaceae bacterium]|nr:hypothetical protein [Muribaculaceae bacterium]